MKISKGFSLLVLALSNLWFGNFLYSEERDVIQYEQVMTSARTHYPLVQSALADVNAAKYKVKEARGDFDLKLKVKGDNRAAGYYDGSYVESVIEKPLGYLNSSVYGGYRISDGDYPVYEGKKNTLDNGEVMAGVRLSLWQNRDIDESRLVIRNSRLKLSQKELKVLEVQAKTMKVATKAYWNWVAAGSIYGVYQEMLDIGIQRNEALKRRIEQGDLAKIYQTENEQYILKRSTQLWEAKQAFEEAALELSLFLRTEDGNPYIPGVEELPESMPGGLSISNEKVEKELGRALLINPEFKIINLETKEWENIQKEGRNKRAPVIDIAIEGSRDYGQGEYSLDEPELKGMFSVVVPLEQNKGKGKEEKAIEEIKSLEHRRRLLKEELEVSIKRSQVSVNTAVQTMGNLEKEVKLSYILAEAERKKFAQGDSDFFVVNLREQNRADTEVKYIKASLSYQKYLADYNAYTYNYLVHYDLANE